MAEDEVVVAAEGAVSEGASDESLDQGTVGEPTEGATGEAVTGGSEEPKFTVKVNGRDTDVTLDELTSGYMRTADYTRKTQEVSRQREEIAQVRALADALERDPRGTLIALAGALKVDLGGSPGSQIPVEDQDPLAVLGQKVDALAGNLTAQQLAAQEQQRQAQISQRALAAVEQEIATLKDNHGDFDQDALVQYAVAHGTPNLAEAYKAWQFDLAEVRRLNELNKTVAAKRAAQVVNGGDSVAPGSVTAGSGSQRPTVREAFRMALASAGGQ